MEMLSLDFTTGCTPSPLISGPLLGPPTVCAPHSWAWAAEGSRAAGQGRHFWGKARVFLAQHWGPEHQHQFLFPLALDSTLLSLAEAPIRTGSCCPEGWKRP